MGDRLIRSVLLVNDLKVEKIICDNPGELKLTSYEEVLANI
jgi:hypothetical protein